MHNNPNWDTYKKQIRISQFNILAHNLCESGGFVVSDPKVLTWDYRKNLYKDIVTKLKSILIPLGFLYVWQRKFYTQPNDPNDGTAIFWRKDLFKFRDQHILQYIVNNGELKTQFAMIICLESIADSTFSVCIVATHLKSKSEFEKIRLDEVRHLMEELPKFNIHNYPVIICGDFNDTPNSSVCKEVESKYTSAYAHNSSAWTTCKKRIELVCRVIDYIFFDSAKLECIQTLDIPNEPINLPSPSYPSDHILIGATFTSRL